VLPCEEGWVESEDGLYCEPVYDECPSGERPLLGGGCERVIPLEEDCPPGPFPEVPEGATDVVYVLADSTCTESCGTAGAPFPWLQEAVDALPEGGYVLVGEGVYDEGVVINKPVHVVGLCPAKVTLVGETDVGGMYDSEVEAVGIAIADTAGASVSGVSVLTEAVGVAVINSTDITLDTLDVAGSVGTGVSASAGSVLQLVRLWVHDTVPGSEMDGNGLRTGGGTDVSLLESLLESVRGAAILANDAETTVTVENSTIRLTGGDATGFGGFAIDAKYSDVSLHGSVLEGNRMVAIFLQGATAVVERSAVRGTKPSPDGAFGHGIEACAGSELAVVDSILDKNTTYGIALFDSGTSATVNGTVIRNTKPDPTGQLGFGIQARDGAIAKVSSALLLENANVGILVFDGSSMDLKGCAIGKTKPTKLGQGGMGLQAHNGAVVDLSYSLVDANMGVGLMAAHSSTQLAARWSVIRGTIPETGGEFGQAVQAGKGAQLTLQQCLVEDSASYGLAVFDSGTQATVTNCLVRDTKPDGQGNYGFGMYVRQGAGVDLSRVVFDANTSAGVAAADPGTKVEMNGTVIRGTKVPWSGLASRAVQAGEGSELIMVGCLAKDNAGYGVAAFDAGTTVSLNDTVIRNISSLGEGELGFGVKAYGGPDVHVSSSLIAANAAVGILLRGDDTQVEVKDSAVVETGADANGEAYAGVLAAEGALLTLEGSLVRANYRQGVAFTTGAHGTLTSCKVHDTRADETGSATGIAAFPGSQVTVSQCLLGAGQSGTGAVLAGADGVLSGSVVLVEQHAAGGMGAGVQVTDEGQLAVLGCLVEGPWESALGVFGVGSGLAVEGTIVRDTATALGEGYGMAADGGAQGAAQWCLVQHAGTAGVGVFGQGTVLSVSDSSIVQTGSGGPGGDGTREEAPAQFGDGLFVGFGGCVEVQSCVVTENARCGLYCHAAASTVGGSIIAANASSGVALSGCDYNVGRDEAVNHILGNATALPPRPDRDVAIDPVGLPVPSSPEIRAVPDMPELPE